MRSRLVAVSNLCRILGSADSASRIRADAYLRSVAEAVSSAVGSSDRIVVELQAPACELTTSQAATLGLIANEAMTNSYKHAFVDRDAGRICVSLSENADDLTLIVADDGQGLSKTARDGLGTTLIESLAVDLAGDVCVLSDDGGTRVKVSFPREL